MQPNAAKALAAVESVARWDDAVTAEQLRFFRDAYVRVSEQAAVELAEAGARSESVPLEALDGLCPTDARTALLRVRLEACVRVRQLASLRARRASLARPLLLTVLALACALLVFRHKLDDPLDLHDVSRGKAWTASSTLGPPWPTSGRLGDFSQPFFVHTRGELRPWLQIDLGNELPVRSATIVNRSDCCGSRALPLRIEVSRDARHWTTAAKRTLEFSVWNTPLDVNGAVRFVRLIILRESCLHLKAVTIRS